MGEQSKENEPDEAASYNPFVRSTVEYDAATRLLMAENIASTRRLIISPALKEIIASPENFYQGCQQSFKMTEDANRRRLISYNTKREAYINQRRSKGLPLPSKIQMIEINPTRVTLSLELEYQYYSLMTNDYGEHENVASIMNETNTLIQLPDRSASDSEPDPYVQQVSITGNYIDVDRARTFLRQNCHISVFLSLSHLHSSNTDIHAFIGQNPIQNVEMFFIDAPSDKNNTVRQYLRFTCREKNKSRLIQAANDILHRFYGKNSSHIFSLFFTLTAAHSDLVIGSSSTKLFIPEIEGLTKTCITFPDSKKAHGNVLVIEIRGAVENILEARRHIMDLLPISMCLNILNSDMKVPSKDSDRNISLTVCGTNVKTGPSIYEPRQILSKEFTVHFVRIWSREFNVKDIYTTYKKVVSDKFDITALEPTDYKNSVWLKNFPEKQFTFSIPFRGQTQSPSNNICQESVSVTSSRSNNENLNRGKSCSESSENNIRYPTRTSSVSESGIPQFHAMSAMHDPVAQSHYAQMMMLQTPYLKGPPGLPVHVFPFFMDPAGVPIPFRPESLQFDPFTYLQFPVPLIGEAESPTCRPESLNSVQTQQSNRKSSRHVNRPSTSAGTYPQSSGSSGQQRTYEKTNDDARSSPKSLSRRTSISIDDPSSDNFEDRGFEQQYQRPYTKFSKDDVSRWKTGSRGDTYSKRGASFHRDYRGMTRDQEYGFARFGTPDRAPSEDQIQFQSTHHLKLKPNEIDLENERLFTHDSPLVEKKTYSADDFGNELTDGDFQRLLSSASLNDPVKRMRAASFLDRDDQSTTLTDSDRANSVNDNVVIQTSRSTDSSKKPTLVSGVAVSKTMLEPRSRNEREYGKVSLEHKDKHHNDLMDCGKHEDSGSALGMLQYRIDPMTLIASVHEASEQLPRIHERQFNDVLIDKEKEMAAFRKKMESTLVQDPTMDETSPMDYAFRNEHSTENIP